MKPLRDLIDGFPHRLLQGALDQEIASVEYDSRRTGPQSLFVCIRGARHDGHRFIPEALSRGAGAFLVERDVRGAGGAPVPGTIVQVEEARRAPPPLAARCSAFPPPGAASGGGVCL